MTGKKGKSAEHEFLRVILTVETQGRDLVSEALWAVGSLGCLEETTSEGVRFIAYFSFDSKESLSELKASLDRHAVTLHSFSSDRFGCDSNKWIENYTQHFRGFEISPTIFIHPSWEKPSSSHRINLLLEPGHGFGTGTPESTQLALLGLEELVSSANSMLDFGTGSGILALAAMKLNPDLDCVGFDIDPMAVEFAARNMKTNHASKVKLFTGPAEALTGTYDFLAANLTAEIFRQQAPEIVRLSRRHLLLSGFTRDQRTLVLETFRDCLLFRLRLEWERNDWLCFHCERW